MDDLYKDGSNDFGKIIKEKRIAKGYTLKQFGYKFGYDLLLHSRMERGLVKPFTSFSFHKKLCNDLDLNQEERRELMLALIASVNGGPGFSIERTISSSLGEAYVDWCAKQGESDSSTWLNTLDNIEFKITQALESFREDAESNILRVSRKKVKDGISRPRCCNENAVS